MPPHSSNPGHKVGKIPFLANCANCLLPSHPRSLLFPTSLPPSLLVSLCKTLPFSLLQSLLSLPLFFSATALQASTQSSSTCQREQSISGFYRALRVTRPLLNYWRSKQRNCPSLSGQGRWVDWKKTAKCSLCPSLSTLCFPLHFYSFLICPLFTLSSLFLYPLTHTFTSGRCLTWMSCSDSLFPESSSVYSKYPQAASHKVKESEHDMQ